MAFPGRQMTAVACLGSVLFMLVYRDRSRGHLAQVLALLWLAQLAAWIVWSTFIYARFMSPLRHLPQPDGAHWLFGHGSNMSGGSMGVALRKWAREIPHDGLIRYRFLFNRERLLINSPRALAEVLVTKNYVFEKPDAVRGSIGRLLGHGILLAEGDEHKVQRRNLMPAFQYRHVKDLYPIFWAKAGSAVRAMTAACGDGSAVLEVNSWASRCTLDIIGAAGMGVDFNSIEDENSELAQTYAELLRPSRQASVLMVLNVLLPGWLVNSLPLRRNREITRASQRIRAVCRQMIRDKKQRLARKDAERERDILTVALGSGMFGDEQLVDQLMTFLAAGHETTASALTWALYQLSRFPEKQRRLRDEVRSRLAPVTDDGEGGGRGVSSDEVDGLPYLNAVCSEVLRVNSPVPVTVREAMCDTTIQGLPVRRGTRIILAPWATNSDPSLWGEDAAEFRPERWLSSAQEPPRPPVEESPSASPSWRSAAADKGSTAAATATTAPGGGGGSGGASSNYAFMTFLHGPRSCIGAGFARAELACVLAGWVGRFEFELEDSSLVDESKLDLKMAVTARPADGMHLRTRVVPGW